MTKNNQDEVVDLLALVNSVPGPTQRSLGIRTGTAVCAVAGTMEHNGIGPRSTRG